MYRPGRFRNVILRARTTNDLKKCSGPQILMGNFNGFVWSRKLSIVRGKFGTANSERKSKGFCVVQKVYYGLRKVLDHKF